MGKPLGSTYIFDTKKMTRFERKVVCIGSVVWDLIGRSNDILSFGNDTAGSITRRPGGVAFNIARQLAKLGARPIMLSIIGQDIDGDKLHAECNDLGLDMQFVTRSKALPTDCYMAIEDRNGLVVAIADTNSLECEGENILEPILHGQLGSLKDLNKNIFILDGNLTEIHLHKIACTPALKNCELKIAPASPGKAERLRIFFKRPNTTLFCNLIEAEILADASFSDAKEASLGLMETGLFRAIVTDGANLACDATLGSPPLTATPDKVKIEGVTGAGDVFMAAHIFAEMNSATPHDALLGAIRTAAAYVSGELI